MLSSNDVINLSYYFSNFDRIFTEELAVSDPPDERELTRRLGRMIAGDKFWSIDYMDAQEWLEGSLGWSLQLTMQAHPTGWEHHVSHSDFGLVISFTDELRQMPVRSAAYLVQAKRLYRKNGRYSLASEFGGVDHLQHLKLRYLASRLGEAAVKFGAYCPPLEIFEPSSIEAIQKTHKSNASALYVGSTFGLALQHQIDLEPSPVSKAGFWIASTLGRFDTAADLHRDAILRDLPFGWFVIANAWNLSISESQHRRAAPFAIPWLRANPAFESVFNIGASHEAHRLAMGLARGDDSVARELAAGTDAKIPASTFKPSVTFEITATRRAHPLLKPTYDDTAPDDPRPGPIMGRI